MALKVRTMVGSILIVASIVHLAFFFLVATGLGALYMQQGLELTDRVSRWGIVGPFLSGFAMLVLGLVLREGKKRVLLFLRPFNSVANELAMNAISRRLGGGLTAVALDDGRIPAPKSSFGDMAVGIGLFFPTGLLLLLFSAVTLPNTMDKLRNPELNSWVAKLPALVSAYVGLLAIRKAFRALFPKSNKIELKSDKQLSPVMARVGALSTWLPRMFFPRSLVIQSCNEYWKQAVENIGERCDLAVIDLSRNSESLAWELSYLDRRMKGRFVITAEEGVVLTIPESANGAPVIRYKGHLSRDHMYTNALRECLRTLSGG